MPTAGHTVPHTSQSLRRGASGGSPRSCPTSPGPLPALMLAPDADRDAQPGFDPQQPVRRHRSVPGLGTAAVTVTGSARVRRPPSNSSAQSSPPHRRPTPTRANLPIRGGPAVRRGSAELIVGAAQLSPRRLPSIDGGGRGRESPTWQGRRARSGGPPRAQQSSGDRWCGAAQCRQLPSVEESGV